VFLEFLQTITGVFVVVYDGQHALKFTLGRAQAVVGPGIRFKLPIIQTYRVEDTRHTTLDLEPQTIQLSDDLVYEVDCKVMYQIVDLYKALIEVDDLVTGLQNRVVLAVQRVVRAQDRRSILDTPVLVDRIRAELVDVEEQWGVSFLEIGFSNLSPSPASLEITQLEQLARERLGMYRGLRGAGLNPQAAVALVTGAVVTTRAEDTDDLRATEGDTDLQREDLEQHLEELRGRRRDVRPPVKGSEDGGADDPGEGPVPAPE